MSLPFSAREDFLAPVDKFAELVTATNGKVSLVPDSELGRFIDFASQVQALKEESAGTMQKILLSVASAKADTRLLSFVKVLKSMYGSLAKLQ